MTVCDGQVKDDVTVLTTVCLVRSIEAVGSSVTLPAAVDALATAAEELQGGAAMRAGRGRALGAAALGPLVRAVGAVDVPVAGPEARHAHGVVALERRRAAGGGRTRGLVAAVVAVRLVVTLEGGRHALTAAAPELGAGATPRG